MTRAKVKITDLKTGQEYLLLVSKMNAKGLLVTSNRTLDPKTPLKLSLQLADEEEPLKIEGEVHKIAEHPNRKKGIIIRFLNPQPYAVDRIALFLEESKTKTVEMPADSDSSPPSREKTALADIQSLSHLALSSPDRESKAIPSTMDEEVMHSKKPGLAGDTRLYNVGNQKSPLSRGLNFSRIFLFIIIPLFLILAVLSFWIYSRMPLPSMGKKVSEKIPPPSSPIPTPFEPSPSDKTATKPITLDKKEITDITVERRGSSLVVFIRGSGDFSQKKLSKATSPKRLNVDLPKIKNYSVPENISVTKNPLLRIRTLKLDPGIRVTLDLYPVAFPKYRAVSKKDGLEIQLHR